MKKIVGALTATTIALTAGMAFASNAAPNAHKAVRAEWAKIHAQGSYGFPLIAVPRAIVRAITGEPERPPIAQSQAVEEKKN